MPVYTVKSLNNLNRDLYFAIKINLINGNMQYNVLSVFMDEYHAADACDNNFDDNIYCNNYTEKTKMDIEMNKSRCSRIILRDKNNDMDEEYFKNIYNQYPEHISNYLTLYVIKKSYFDTDSYKISKITNLPEEIFFAIKIDNSTKTYNSYEYYCNIKKYPFKILGIFCNLNDKYAIKCCEDDFNETLYYSQFTNSNDEKLNYRLLNDSENNIDEICHDKMNNVYIIKKIKLTTEL